MAIIETILAGGIKPIFQGIGGLAKDIRAAITGREVLDPTKLAELEAKAMEIEFAATKAQTDINLEEAKHPNIFVSGARPFIMWVCGVALAWQFIGNPIFDWIVKLSGKVITPPVIDTGSLTTILMALLGLGGLRTFEKYKGSQSNH